MKVIITNPRDLGPCAHLLEALTKANLLASTITWEESLDKIILHIPKEAAPVFQSCRY